MSFIAKCQSQDTRLEKVEHKVMIILLLRLIRGLRAIFGAEHDLNSNDESFSESRGYFESLLDTCVCLSVFTHPAGRTPEPRSKNKKVYGKNR